MFCSDAPVYGQVHHVVSDKACATIIILPEQDTTIVCFRGTKVSDILTHSPS